MQTLYCATNKPYRTTHQPVVKAMPCDSRPHLKNGDLLTSCRQAGCSVKLAVLYVGRDMSCRSSESSVLTSRGDFLEMLRLSILYVAPRTDTFGRSSPEEDSEGPTLIQEASLPKVQRPISAGGSTFTVQGT